VAQYQVGGKWEKSLRVTVSDSEGYSSVPDLITIRPSITDIPPGAGPVSLAVNLSLNGDLSPGLHTVAVTVSDGLVSQTAYLFVTVA